MKKLVLLLLIPFLSTQSFAEKGDVYFCNVIHNVAISKGTGVQEQELGTFKMKWDKDSVVFSGEELDGHILKINKERSYKNSFLASDEGRNTASFRTTSNDKGIVAFAAHMRIPSTGPMVITYIAECSKF